MLRFAGLCAHSRENSQNSLRFCKKRAAALFCAQTCLESLRCLLALCEAYGGLLSVQAVPDATEGHYRSSMLNRNLCKSSLGARFSQLSEHKQRIFSQLPKRQQRASDAGLHTFVVPWIWHHAAVQRPQHNLLGVVLLRVGKALHQRIAVGGASAAPRIAKEIHETAATAFWQLLVPLERPGRRWRSGRNAAAISLWCHGDATFI